jgi:hypothetical protein
VHFACDPQFVAVTTSPRNQFDTADLFRPDASFRAAVMDRTGYYKGILDVIPDDMGEVAPETTMPPFRLRPPEATSTSFAKRCRPYMTGSSSNRGCLAVSWPRVSSCG